MYNSWRLEMANRNEVAKRAGVSPAVVSYVLNNSNYVSEEKRKAVLQAVEELDYYPNYFARSLKKRNGHQLLMLSDDMRNDVFLELAYEMENYAFEKGYYITVGFCSAEKIPFYTNMLLSRQCDGLFVANNMFSADQLELIAKKVPTVLFQTKLYENLSEDISVVSGDIADGMEQLVHHLVDCKGYRRLVYIGSTYTKRMPDEKTALGSGLRLKGFLEAAKKRDLLLDRDVMVVSSLIGSQENQYSLDAYVDKALTLWNPKEPTVFVVANDSEAARCISLLQRRGYSVPQDIAVAGFGGTSSGCITNPQLTTVSYPKKEIAKAGIDILLSDRQDRKRVHLQYPMTLIERGST